MRHGSPQLQPTWSGSSLCCSKRCNSVGMWIGRLVLAPTKKYVVWCTGYETKFDWIDLPVLDERGDPMHRRGEVAKAPGLYFVGLQFLYAFSSTMIHGVGRDAAYVAKRIAERVRQVVGSR